MGGQDVGALLPPVRVARSSLNFSLLLYSFTKYEIASPHVWLAWFFFPFPLLSIVKHFAGVHVFDVGLHLFVVAGVCIFFAVNRVGRRRR